MLPVLLAGGDIHSFHQTLVTFQFVSIPTFGGFSISFHIKIIPSIYSALAIY